jgi:hypothetical protein
MTSRASFIAANCVPVLRSLISTLNGVILEGPASEDTTSPGERLTASTSIFGAAPLWGTASDKPPVARLTRTPAITALASVLIQTAGFLNQRFLDELSSLPDEVLRSAPSGVVAMNASPPRRTSAMVGGPKYTPIVLVLTIDACLLRVDVNERRHALAGRQRGAAARSARSSRLTFCIWSAFAQVRHRRNGHWQNRAPGQVWLTASYSDRGLSWPRSAAWPQPCAKARSPARGVPLWAGCRPCGRRPALYRDVLSRAGRAAHLKDLRSRLVCGQVSTLSLESRPATMPGSTPIWLANPVISGAVRSFPSWAAALGGMSVSAAN